MSHVILFLFTCVKRVVADDECDEDQMIYPQKTFVAATVLKSKKRPQIEKYFVKSFLRKVKDVALLDPSGYTDNDRLRLANAIPVILGFYYLPLE